MLRASHLTLVIPAVACAAAFLIAGEDAKSDSAPCLVIWHTGGMQENPNHGLEVAIWSDGVVLLSPLPESLGKHMLTGRIDKQELADALRCIHDVGFSKLTRDWQVPDSEFTTIAVLDGQTATHSWHEYLMPGFGGDLNTDADYRAFIRTWKKTRAAIEGLAPIELRPIGNAKEFRGYLVDAPYKTTWRPW